MFKSKTSDNEVQSRNFLYAVYDEKAATYGPPMLHVSDGVAVRGFSAACKNTQSFLYQYPSDYTLYCIGHYDERTGKCTSYNEPRYVVRASEVISILNQNPTSEAPNEVVG